jgi:hypothetical protein
MLAENVWYLISTRHSSIPASRYVSFARVWTRADERCYRLPTTLSPSRSNLRRTTFMSLNDLESITSSLKWARSTRSSSLLPPSPRCVLCNALSGLADDQYADPVLDMLDTGRVVRHRLFRESCYNHKGNYVKVRLLLIEGELS